MLQESKTISVLNTFLPFAPNCWNSKEVSHSLFLTVYFFSDTEGGLPGFKGKMLYRFN